VDVGAALRGDENVTLFEAQRLKEIEQFRKLRLANDEKEARLVEADVVARVWANMATLLRNKLLSIPNTLAQRCAFETDPFEIRNMIDAEIKHALEAFPTVISGYEAE
jgi:phage terminase Nu1 subunit (DNA packaging protein)